MHLRKEQDFPEFKPECFELRKLKWFNLFFEDGDATGGDAGAGGDGDAGDSAGADGSGTAGDGGVDGSTDAGSGDANPTAGMTSPQAAAALSTAEVAAGIDADSASVGAAIAASQGVTAALSQATSLANVLGAVAVGALGAVVGQAVASAVPGMAFGLATAIGLTPTAAIALAALATAYATNKAVDFSQHALSSNMSGVVGSAVSSLDGLSDMEGSGDIEKIKDFFSGVADEDIPEFIANKLKDTESIPQPLYRRRSNIIGTGLQGLTIE